jgi:ADP-ribosylglycohydrolase
MYMSPVGVVNAGDPAAAYAEAIELAAPHQSSYGREAAGVFAAAVAASLAPHADVTTVVDACLEVGHDGTRAAVEAVVKAAASASSVAPDELASTLRSAVEPYDTVGSNYRQPAADARRPSRTKSIEELPIALGFVVAHGADFSEAVLGAVNYGRDSDSIATMAGAVCGGLGGAAVVPSDWVSTIETNSRLDITGMADRLADIAARVLESDRVRLRQRLAQIDGLLGTP